MPEKKTTRQKPPLMQGLFLWYLNPNFQHTNSQFRPWRELSRLCSGAFNLHGRIPYFRAAKTTLAMTHASASKPVNRIFGLDLLRVVAVFTVLFAHAGFGKFYGIEYGFLAIETFFVMSGFLIGEMLIREFQHGFTLFDLRVFWVKRWFRTLPLYYFVLFAKFFLTNPDGIGWNILYYVFFLQNNFYGVQFFTVSWTLVLEEWFYVIMPLIIYLFFRKGIIPRKFYVFVLSVVLFSLLARFYVRLSEDRYLPSHQWQFRTSIRCLHHWCRLGGCKAFSWRLVCPIGLVAVVCPRCGHHGFQPTFVL